MHPPSILPPVFALVALSFVVLIVMFLARVNILKRDRIHMEKLADNFINLFEMPVLFYVAALLIHFTGITDRWYLCAAWAYVALRVAHSLVHCTSNRACTASWRTPDPARCY